MYDVSCIGILVTDVIAKPVDKIPSRGKLGLIDSIEVFSGGCAMSAAIALAKLGAKTCIIGKIGNDSFGKMMYDILKTESVSTDGLIIDSNVSTSASIVLSDSLGERTFLHCASSNDNFNENELDYNLIKNSKIAFVAGTMLMESFDGAQCAVALKKSKELGVITALDTAWDDKGRWMDILFPSMPFIDYFLPSIEEATELSKKTDYNEIADYFFSLGVKHVVIKLGKKGCFIKETQGSKSQILPVKDVKVIDTTGAGDSFCAGFLYGISHGMSFYDSAALANDVGTLCVQKKGATTGIIPFTEIGG